MYVELHGTKGFENNIILPSPSRTSKKLLSTDSAIILLYSFIVSTSELHFYCLHQETNPESYHNIEWITVRPGRIHVKTKINLEIYLDNRINRDYSKYIDGCHV
jgi:hypothetical protein